VTQRRHLWLRLAIPWRLILLFARSFDFDIFFFEGVLANPSLNPGQRTIKWCRNGRSEISIGVAVFIATTRIDWRPWSPPPLVWLRVQGRIRLNSLRCFLLAEAGGGRGRDTAPRR
jgi:hypothetical protein